MPGLRRVTAVKQRVRRRLCFHLLHNNRREGERAVWDQPNPGADSEARTRTCNRVGAIREEEAGEEPSSPQVSSPRTCGLQDPPPGPFTGGLHPHLLLPVQAPPL